MPHEEGFVKPILLQLVCVFFCVVLSCAVLCPACVLCACAVCAGLPTAPLVNATWPEGCRNTAVNDLCISKVGYRCRKCIFC